MYFTIVVVVVFVIGFKSRITSNNTTIYLRHSAHSIPSFSIVIATLCLLFTFAQHNTTRITSPYVCVCLVMCVYATLNRWSRDLENSYTIVVSFKGGEAYVWVCARSVYIHDVEKLNAFIYYYVIGLVVGCTTVVVLVVVVILSLYTAFFRSFSVSFFLDFLVLCCFVWSLLLLPFYNASFVYVCMHDTIKHSHDRFVNHL